MFRATLINHPFGDPGVYVESKYRRNAFLFDLGDLHALPARNILKIRQIFVSHTHMDHFIGFDHLLRVCLGRDRHIHLFGPPEFLQNVENKLRAYSWNLVENYENDFVLLVTEVHPEGKITRRYRCRAAFQPETVREESPFEDLLLEERLFKVKAAFLDHHIPCLAFRFDEKKRINIKKIALQEMGLPTGAWLMSLKDHVLNADPDDLPVRVWWKEGGQKIAETFIPLGELREKVVKMTPGQAITYVTDVHFSEENARRIIELAKGSDLLFIESTFLHEDLDRAEKKGHLTARQAGTLAGQAGVKRLCPFHFSPKYKGSYQTLIQEALAAFADAQVNR